MKQCYFLLVFILFFQINFAQTSADSLPTTLEKFDLIIEDSGNYKEYKVVKKSAIQQIKNMIIYDRDSLMYIIENLEANTSKLNNTIESLEKELDETQSELSKLKEEKSSIAFLGLQLNKTTYHIIVWSIIFILLFLCIIVYINYRRSNLITRTTQENMKNLETEYEEYRRNAIEKQQQQGRKILDLQKSVKKKPGAGNAGPKTNNT
jgi:tetrahydromethanopterin S-methyltransferase subunit B